MCVVKAKLIKEIYESNKKGDIIALSMSKAGIICFRAKNNCVSVAFLVKECQPLFSLATIFLRRRERVDCVMLRYCAMYFRGTIPEMCFMGALFMDP